MSKAEEEFFRSSYGTLLMGIIVLAAQALLYYVLYRELFGPYDSQLRLAVLAGVATFLLGLTSLLFSGAKLFGVAIEGAQELKRVFLPGAVVSLIALTGMLCSLTGGVTASPFSHYLTAMGGLASVFARQMKTKIVIIAATIITFHLSGRFYYPLCGTDGAAAICSDGEALTGSLLLFNDVSVLVIGTMAIIAAWRTLPQLPGRAVSDAGVEDGNRQLDHSGSELLSCHFGRTVGS